MRVLYACLCVPAIQSHPCFHPSGAENQHPCSVSRAPSFSLFILNLFEYLNQVTEMALKAIRTPRFRQGATELVVALGQSEEVGGQLPVQIAAAAAMVANPTATSSHFFLTWRAMFFIPFYARRLRAAATPQWFRERRDTGGPVVNA